MRNLPPFPLIMATVLAVSGRASSGDGHYSGDYIGPVYPASGMYYGSRDYYYHDDYPDYIVAPRPPLHVPDRPDYRPGLHPEHPIANPPGTQAKPAVYAAGRSARLPLENAIHVATAGLCTVDARACTPQWWHERR